MSAYPHVDKALGYINAVLSGDEPACKWVRLACQRALDDRKREADPSWPYRFDPERAEHNCTFAELFSHVKGKWAGKPYRLEPWQCFRRCEVFGWVRKQANEDGLHARRFREAYLEVPRKNGKSIEEGLDGDYCLTADGEKGAECFSGATTEKQAWEVFKPARLMALQTPTFTDAFGVTVNAKSLTVDSTGAKFEPLIGKPGDGASPHWACADEYHEHETDDFADTMKTGMLAREQPLLEYATTAGENIAGPCYAKREDVQKMLEGIIPNEELWGIIYTIDDEPYLLAGKQYQADDWTTEAALRKANPNFGISVNAETLRADQLVAIRDPRKQGVFKTKHLNVWVNSRAAWMNMESWKRCANPTLTLESCIGLPCWIGLDMAAKIAFCSACIVFVDDRKGVKHYKLFWRHYLPEETANDPTKQHYLKWVHDGWVTATEGGEVDFTRVEDELAALCSTVSALELDFDPRHGTQASQRIERLSGTTRVEMPQTVDTFSPAMYELEAAVTTGRLEHNGEPVATWFFSNVVAKPNARQALYPRSSRPGVNHIDGAVAAMFAVNRGMAYGLPKQSVYEQNGPEAWSAPEETPAEGDASIAVPRSTSIYDQYTREEWTR